MPVKLGSRLPPDSAEARIEIIPLIDIMFFLLAAFMLVSLSLVNLHHVPVKLPTATVTATENLRGFVNLTIDRAGLLFLERQPLGRHELAATLTAWHRTNTALRVLVNGDAEARHGDVLGVLDLVRAAGIENVAFEVRPADATPPPP
jgi:biopolymer transport protein ExbD